jgi:hypothetical protein
VKNGQSRKLIHCWRSFPFELANSWIFKLLEAEAASYLCMCQHSIFSQRKIEILRENKIMFEIILVQNSIMMICKARNLRRMYSKVKSRPYTTKETEISDIVDQQLQKLPCIVVRT